jgi:hypothetical protein
MVVIKYTNIAARTANAGLELFVCVRTRDRTDRTVRPGVAAAVLYFLLFEVVNLGYQFELIVA